jgi:hypothetical protein
MSIFKRKPPLQRELLKAIELLRKLFTLKIVKVFLTMLAVAILAPLILFLILKPKPQEEINYGVTFSKKYTEEMGLDWKYTYTQILDDLGAKNIRVVAYWDDSEPTPDNYDFSDVKWQIEEAGKRDASVIMTIGRKVPRFPECFQPEWWEQLESSELKELELYEYIKMAVGELKGYDNIKMWQVENEPFWPFGECEEIEYRVVKKEVEIVKGLDDRPVLIQDSGEGGVWFPTYSLGDYLGISMYRKIWYDFWGLFFGNFIYFKYPLAHWSYKIKANLVQVPMDRIYVTELQAEPWGPGLNSTLTKAQKNKTMSRNDFMATMNYAQKSGFKDLYLWGPEWWLFEKEQNGNSFYWDAGKALFSKH